MDFMNTLAYVLYPVYNWLGIHNAPDEVLDLITICVLVENGLYGYITRKHKR